VRYVFEGRQGVSYGRNAGVAAARAPIVAFTDDDVRARPDWTRTIARAFAEHPWADFVGGRVLPRWPAPPPAWLTPEHWSPLALVDYGDAPLRVDAARPITLVTCNAAFRRAAFERVGGFDSRHQHRPGAVSACEDHELETRIVAAGGAGLYVPEMVIEAEVQERRLTRAYHRRWHRDHGRALVGLLRPGETFDGRGHPVPIAPGKPTLFGAAPWVYRSAAASALRTAAAWARARPADAFRHECDFLEAAGHIAGWVQRWRAGGAAGRR
jgi:glycosyltransferase involved in cell wall biosynthesis